jgi:hypothetical protein
VKNKFNKNLLFWYVVPSLILFLLAGTTPIVIIDKKIQTSIDVFLMMTFPLALCAFVLYNFVIRKTFSSLFLKVAVGIIATGVVACLSFVLLIIYAFSDYTTSWKTEKILYEHKTMRNKTIEIESATDFFDYKYRTIEKVIFYPFAYVKEVDTLEIKHYDWIKK